MPAPQASQGAGPGPKGGAVCRDGPHATRHRLVAGSHRPVGQPHRGSQPRRPRFWNGRRHAPVEAARALPRLGDPFRHGVARGAPPAFAATVDATIRLAGIRPGTITSGAAIPRLSAMVPRLAVAVPTRLAVASRAASPSGSSATRKVWPVSGAGTKRSGRAARNRRPADDPGHDAPARHGNPPHFLERAVSPAGVGGAAAATAGTSPGPQMAPARLELAYEPARVLRNGPGAARHVPEPFAGTQPAGPALADRHSGQRSEELRRRRRLVQRPADDDRAVDAIPPFRGERKPVLPWRAARGEEGCRDGRDHRP